RAGRARRRAAVRRDHGALGAPAGAARRRPGGAAAGVRAPVGRAGAAVRAPGAGAGRPRGGRGGGVSEQAQALAEHQRAIARLTPILEAMRSIAEIAWRRAAERL